MASQGKGGKLKGDNFERKVAKLFETWWQAGGLEGEFYKTPASGGLRWRGRPDTIGDISVPVGFLGTIECKDTESWKYSELFTKTIAREAKNSPRTIGEFWFQTCEEAGRAFKIPLLIFSKNYQKDLIVFPVDTVCGVFYDEEYKQWAIRKHFVFESYSFKPYFNVVIMRFDKFLELTDPKMLHKDSERE